VYFVYCGPDEIRISQMIGAERPVFGIDVPWPLSWREAATNNDVRALPTLEQFVATFVDVLSAHLGSSRCVLAGYSFGGLMAFEAAHQLRRRGTQVDAVIMLDAKAPHQGIWYRLQRAWWETSSEISFRTISLNSKLRRVSWRMLVRAGKALLRPISAWSQPPFNPPRRSSEELATQPTIHLDEQGEPIDWSLITRLYGNATKTYAFQPLDSKGVLFTAQYESLTDFDASLGWANLFRKGLEIMPVSGDHFTIVRHEPHVRLLGQKLNEVLERY